MKNPVHYCITGTLCLVLSSVAQTAPGSPSEPPSIPAGSKIPLVLKQAISTKNAKEGDPVYAETAFPFVIESRMLVPAGTYVQGVITHVERAGRIKGRAEIQMHFTSMIYPSGYTVLLPASVDSTPGADDHTVTDKEGTITHDGETGKKLGEAARNGVYGTIGGATAGGLATGGLNGARVGAGAGAAVGVAWALLKRGSDVKLDPGTSVEMVIVRPVPLDPSRMPLYSNR